jgi:hypothetical protein
MHSKQELARFITDTFRSVWSLEVLCFLKQNRGRNISPGELIAGLRGSDLVVSQSVESLLAAGLVVVEEDRSVRYGPATVELEQLVEGAAALYAKSPDGVRRTIVAAANPGVTAFADAFRLRKE